MSLKNCILSLFHGTSESGFVFLYILPWYGKITSITKSLLEFSSDECEVGRACSISPILLLMKPRNKKFKYLGESHRTRECTAKTSAPGFIPWSLKTTLIISFIKAASIYRVLTLWQSSQCTKSPTFANLYLTKILCANEKTEGQGSQLLLATIKSDVVVPSNGQLGGKHSEQQVQNAPKRA